MRILQIDKFLRRSGGAATYLLDLSALLDAAGHEVEFFSMQHAGNVPATYAEHFVPAVQTDPPPDSLRSRVGVAATMVHSRRAARSIEAVLDDFTPDVVHVHNIYHQLSPSILGPIARRNIPVVLTAHDFKLVCPSYRLLDGDRLCTSCVGSTPLHAISRRCKDGSLTASTMLAVESLVHRATRAYDPLAAVIAPSHFLAALLREGTAYADRVRRIPNFVDCETIDPRTGAGADFLYVGRLSREKGVDVLIDAMGRLPSGRLTVAGDGPEADRLRMQADSEAPGRVRFVGQLAKAEVVAEVRRARAAVLPARYFENMPMSILEAMAAGVPMIATDLGGIPELVVDQVSGLLVPPGDPDALAAAMRELDANPVHATELGAAARGRAERLFDAPQHLERILEVYHQVGARHRLDAD